jgi:hypothetical protein
MWKAGTFKVQLHAVLSLSSFWREPFLRSASLGQGVVLDRGVFASTKIYFILSSDSNSVIEFET